MLAHGSDGQRMCLRGVPPSSTIFTFWVTTVAIILSASLSLVAKIPPGVLGQKKTELGWALDWLLWGPFGFGWLFEPPPLVIELGGLRLDFFILNQVC